MKYVLDDFKLYYQLVGNEPQTAKEAQEEIVRRRLELAERLLLLDVKGVARRVYGRLRSLWTANKKRP